MNAPSRIWLDESPSTSTSLNPESALPPIRAVVSLPIHAAVAAAPNPPLCWPAAAKNAPPPFRMRERSKATVVTSGAVPSPSASTAVTSLPSMAAVVLPSTRLRDAEPAMDTAALPELPLLTARPRPTATWSPALAACTFTVPARSAVVSIIRALVSFSSQLIAAAPAIAEENFELLPPTLSAPDPAAPMRSVLLTARRVMSVSLLLSGACTVTLAISAAVSMRERLKTPEPAKARLNLLLLRCWLPLLPDRDCWLLLPPERCSRREPVLLSVLPAPLLLLPSFCGSLTRPWVLLCAELLVLLASLRWVPVMPCFCEFFCRATAAATPSPTTRPDVSAVTTRSPVVSTPPPSGSDRPPVSSGGGRRLSPLLPISPIAALVSVSTSWTNTLAPTPALLERVTAPARP